MDQQQLAKMEHCRSKLVELTQRLGAVESAFIIDFAEPNERLGKSWLKSFKSRDSILFSSAKVSYLFERSRSSMTRLDPDLVKASNKDKHVWLEDKNLKQQQSKLSIIKELGFSKQLSVTFPLQNWQGLKGCYSLFYALDCPMTDEQRFARMDELMADIKMVGTHIVSERVLTGPFEDYQLFKPSTISIIKHLAEGRSRKDLSDIHYMSARGVDYHIEKAKIVLEAQNTSHLVHVAHQMMLI
ncbi:helix-turn-helix transcriptional regulator [Ferrimonas lipolytica]|uniref:Helix-turn-helix transcriptional regulator n=1 Tax=Ferrimonas lipolytica TaxID=2724191 RepID=A0A6H1UEP2_9GAMM|nr:helix-turn-helix transcriptional regulator [Ferrimonas lipolytica]QIZ76262.1 helix-turn-helix transcriptional regulator [Ferrimonas lipolytica]